MCYSYFKDKKIVSESSKLELHSRLMLFPLRDLLLKRMFGGKMNVEIGDRIEPGY